MYLSLPLIQQALQIMHFQLGPLQLLSQLRTISAFFDDKRISGSHLDRFSGHAFPHASARVGHLLLDLVLYFTYHTLHLGLVFLVFLIELTHLPLVLPLRSCLMLVQQLVSRYPLEEWLGCRVHGVPKSHLLLKEIKRLVAEQLGDLCLQLVRLVNHHQICILDSGKSLLDRLADALTFTGIIRMLLFESASAVINIHLTLLKARELAAEALESPITIFFSHSPPLEAVVRLVLSLDDVLDLAIALQHLI